MTQNREHTQSASTSNEILSIEELNLENPIDADGFDDLLGQLPDEEILEQIRNQKKSNPGMFVSGWENDDEGIIEKDMSDPKEQVLTAAEDGEMEKLCSLLDVYPDALKARDQDGYTPLHRAAYNNHVEICRYLLSKGANPESKTDQGWTVLHSAACWTNYKVVAVLLSHGVDVNARSNGGLTPLHLAINSLESSDLDSAKTTVKYLLEAPGVDMSAVNGAGDTPLELAKRSHSELFELLTYYLNRP